MAALVEARDLCYLAGQTVTKAYRAEHRDARALDTTHARLVGRTRLRGTVAVDDPDVVAIVAAALAIGVA